MIMMTGVCIWCGSICDLKNKKKKGSNWIRWIFRYKKQKLHTLSHTNTKKHNQIQMIIKKSINQFNWSKHIENETRILFRFFLQSKNVNKIFFSSNIQPVSFLFSSTTKTKQNSWNWNQNRIELKSIRIMWMRCVSKFSILQFCWIKFRPDIFFLLDKILYFQN